MSEQKLEYQVNSEGQVIRVRAYKDTPAFTLSIGQPVDELPVPRMGFKNDRWISLKREVCHLPMDGKWRPIPAEPAQFPSSHELKLAYQVLKRKADKFMESILNGNKVEVISDKMNLRLYVQVIRKDTPK